MRMHTNPHVNALRSAAISMNSLLEGKATDPVYIINNSDLDGERPKGDVYLTINQANNNPVLINIPSTWVPLDLTSYATRESILTSPDFRRALNNQTLLPISPKVAGEILLTEEAVAEVRSITLRSSMSADGADAASRAAAAQPKNLPERKQALATGQVQMPEAGVSMQVLTALDRNLSASEMLTAFRNMPNITQKDLHHIMASVSSETHGRVLSWARDILAKNS